MIHADMHPGNLLVDGDALTVIDFDDAGFGWHQYDIAVALIYYRLKPYFPEIERAFVQGYRSQRAISAAELALVPMFMLIRNMVQMGWIMLRPELGRSLTREHIDSVCARCAVFEAVC